MDPIIWLFPADLGKRSRENFQPSWSREGYVHILSKGISAILGKMITRVLKLSLSPFWGPSFACSLITGAQPVQEDKLALSMVFACPET